MVCHVACWISVHIQRLLQILAMLRGNCLLFHLNESLIRGINGMNCAIQIYVREHWRQQNFKPVGLGSFSNLRVDSEVYFSFCQWNGVSWAPLTGLRLRIYWGLQYSKSFCSLLDLQLSLATLMQALILIIHYVYHYWLFISQPRCPADFSELGRV